MTQQFIIENKESFDAFCNNKVKAEVEEDFIVLNNHIDEIKCALTSMNSLELMYRNKHSNSWMSHSRLIYECFWKIKNPISLSIFSKILAVELELDFCLCKETIVESMKYPVYSLQSVETYTPYEDLFADYGVADNIIVRIVD